MVITAHTVKALADRLAKAQQLADAGRVHPVAGVTGFYAVEGSAGRAVYLVDSRDGRERCSCPDYQQRQGPAGLPCKHILAVELASAQPVEQPARRPDPALGLAVLTGKRPAA